MNEKKSQKISLYGAKLDVGNQGCTALTVSLIKIFKDLNPDVELFLVNGSRINGPQPVTISGKTITVEQINYRLSPKAKLTTHLFWIIGAALLFRIIPFRPLRNWLCKTTPCIDVIDKSDFVGDIRGGDSFSDVYGLMRMIFGSVIPICTIIMKKKLVLLPQTYGPYKHLISKLIAAFLFQYATKIYARDYISKQVILDNTLVRSKSAHIEFCPDVAFTLEAIKPQSVIIDPPLNKDENYPLIGVNVSGLLYNNGYNQKNMFKLKFNYKHMIENLITLIMDTTECHVLLVPHVFGTGIESDYESCLKILDKLQPKYKDRIHGLRDRYDQNQLKGIIGLCDFFIGSRMHSCIAALSQHIPCIGIAYSQKFRGVFESIGLESYVIDGRTLEEKDVLDRCINLIREKEYAAEQLLSKILLIKNQIHTVFESLLSDVTVDNPQ